MSEIPIPEVPQKRVQHSDPLLLRLQPLLTLVIAITAIGLAFWEGAENRRHNRLSVKPRIGAEINTGRDDGGEFVKMSIESTGLGPAVIKTFRIYFDGVPQDTVSASGTIPWQRAIDAFPKGSQVNAQALSDGYYLPSGNEQVLFEAKRAQPQGGRDSALAAIFSRLAIQICYCSVYSTDCDEVVLSTAPLKTASCLR
jgi:hypothetical protein